MLAIWGLFDRAEGIGNVSDGDTADPYICTTVSSPEIPCATFFVALFGRDSTLIVFLKIVFPFVHLYAVATSDVE